MVYLSNLFYPAHMCVKAIDLSYILASIPVKCSSASTVMIERCKRCPKEDRSPFTAHIVFLILIPLPDQQNKHTNAPHLPLQDINPHPCHQNPIKDPCPLLRTLRPWLMIQKSRMHRTETPFQITLGIKPTNARLALNFLFDFNERRTAFWDRA